MSNQTIATCAACGEKKEICGSVRIDGIQQPRICKECLILGMQIGDYGVTDTHWIRQMIELGDKESLDAIRKQIEKESR
jgi:hypothetical protein